MWTSCPCPGPCSTSLGPGSHPGLVTKVPVLVLVLEQGRLHKGEGVRDAPWRKLGGNVVMIMMLLLVSIIIYYYMNTFITLHQYTFNLLFALFLHCISKKHSRCFQL